MGLLSADKVKLGEKYKDRVTNFEGTVTARHEYMTGCVRYSVEASDKDGQPQEYIFDEERLVEAATEKPPAKTSRSGGARPAPARTGLGKRAGS